MTSPATYHRLGETSLLADLAAVVLLHLLVPACCRPVRRVNREGLDFYRLVDGLLARGIVPNITLFTGTCRRRWKHGGCSRDTVHWFADYAALIARELGDRAPMIATFNEPWCYAYLGHADGHHARPARRQGRGHGGPTNCSPTAWPWTPCGRAERPSLGIVINPSLARSRASRPRRGRSRRIDGIQNRWWFDALTGQYPADVMEGSAPSPLRAAGGLEQIARPLDWIGLNCY